jgi:hypothetical protein
MDVQEVQDALERLLDNCLPDVVDRRQEGENALEEIAQLVFSDER